MNNTNRINVGKIFFDNVTIKEAVSIIKNRISNYNGDNENSQLLVANQDIINKLGTLQDLNANELNKSFLTIADGYSIVYASKYLGTPLKERVTGPDLMKEIINISEIENYRHFFFGAKDGVAKQMASNFLKEYPNLKIVGIESPPFRKLSKDENNQINSMINKSKCDILWVSLGCPKQEIWILQNKSNLNVPVIAGVGAAFDFYSQNVKRAPKWVQNLRLEWFYRILKEPRRLWKRYFVGGFKFFATIKKQKKQKRIQRR